MANSHYYTPPLFPIIGLADRNWIRHRRFVNFSGLVGQPASGVTLEYSSSQSTRLLISTERLHPENTNGELAVSAIHLLTVALDRQASRSWTDIENLMDSVLNDVVNWERREASLDAHPLILSAKTYGDDIAAIAVVSPDVGIAIAARPYKILQNIALLRLRSCEGFGLDFFSPHPATDLTPSQEPPWNE